jgi:excisionase family DNA binding protein
VSRFMTLEETAAFLNLSKTMVYRLSSRSELPGKIELGHRTVRVDREILEAALREKAAGGGGKDADGDPR